MTAAAIAAGAVIPRLPTRVRAMSHLAVTALAIQVARGRSPSWRAVGCDARDVRRGVAHGVVAAAVGALAVTAATRHPATRTVLADGRVTDATSGRAAYELLVRIPVVTALGEELLFRGAVQGAWDTVGGPVPAVAASSLAFGLWHVIPALESHTHNPAGAAISARAGGRPTHVAATILATTAAGVAFALLRIRARSVVAPLLVHAVMNQSAYVAARRAHRADVASPQP